MEVERKRVEKVERRKVEKVEEVEEVERDSVWPMRRGFERGRVCLIKCVNLKNT